MLKLRPHTRLIKSDFLTGEPAWCGHRRHGTMSPFPYPLPSEQNLQPLRPRGLRTQYRAQHTSDPINSWFCTIETGQSKTIQSSNMSQRCKTPNNPSYHEMVSSSWCGRWGILERLKVAHKLNIESSLCTGMPDCPLLYF